MRKIIFLNGPPYSGKDTAAKFITDHYGVVGPWYAREFKFSAPLKRAAQSFFDLTDEDVKYFEEKHNKDRKHPKLADMSWRQVQITLSETWFKPQVGKEGFGIIAHNTIQQSAAQMCVFSDSGFVDEAGPLVSKYGIDNCLLMHITREGCTFEGDSRSYWEMPKMTTVELNNMFDMDMYELQTIRIIDRWLEPRKN